MLNWFRRKTRKAPQSSQAPVADSALVFLPTILGDGSAPVADDRPPDPAIDTDPGTPADPGSHDSTSGHSCGSHSCGGASCGGGGGS